jgi:hypothetical protein
MNVLSYLTDKKSLQLLIYAGFVLIIKWFQRARRDYNRTPGTAFNAF